MKRLSITDHFSSSLYYRKAMRRLTGKVGSQKIFCVGLPKTATTSLSAALNILGYRTMGFSPEHLNRNSEWDYPGLYSAISQADAFRDMPWCFLYRELYEKYPSARFILTIRDEEPWLKSFVRHFSNRPMALLNKGFGMEYPLGNEGYFLEQYRKHNGKVLDFFSSKENLLVMNTKEDLGWDKLCNFLGVSSPTSAFPMERPPSRK